MICLVHIRRFGFVRTVCAVAVCATAVAATAALSEPARRQSHAASRDARPGPVSKAGHTVNFVNKGPAQIALYFTDKSCMHDRGPDSISLDSFGTQSIQIVDSNDWWAGCTNEPKWVTWHAYTVYDNNGQTGKGDYQVTFRHWRDGLLQNAWVTDIEGPEDNSSSGRGMMSGATCDGAPCLNNKVRGGGDTETITFDGQYNGLQQAVKITTPANHSAIDISSTLYMTGLGSALTQVDVSGTGFSGQPWVDASGNWNASTGYMGSANQMTTITATDYNSNDYVHVVYIQPVQITTPSSMAWSDSIAVGGAGNPGSAVHVDADQLGNDDPPGCNATVQTDGTWSCSLQGMSAGQDYTLVAHQTGTASDDGSDSGTWPWTDPTVPQQPLHVDAVAPTITFPLDQSHIDGDTQSAWAVSGTGNPSAQIGVWLLPSSNSCGGSANTNVANASAGPDGVWSTAQVFQFPPQQASYSIVACQTVDGGQAMQTTSTFQSWPSLKIAYPSDGQTLSSSTTGITLSGTGEAGATLTPPSLPSLTLCGSFQIDGNGNWICPASGLQMSTSYDVPLSQSSGGQSDPPVHARFNVAAPVVIDQPTSMQQFPIQTTQIVISGTGQPNALLSVSVVGATACADQIIPGSSAWSCVVNGLKPGQSYTAAAVQGSTSDVPPSRAWKDQPVTQPFSVAGFTTLVISYPLPGQEFASATSQITALGSGQPGAQLNVNAPGATACPPLTIQSTGAWSCDISGFASGQSWVLGATQSLDGVQDLPKYAAFGVAQAVAIEGPQENAVLPAESTDVVMTGTGQPGANINIQTANASPCTTTVSTNSQTAGRWGCDIQSLTVGSQYTSQVTQSGPSWTDPPVPRDFSVAAAAAIAIQYPRNNIMVSSNNPRDGLRVTGVGQDGLTAQVTVGSLQPQGLFITGGTWASDPFDISSFGSSGASLLVTATQYLNGVQQGQPAQANITVAKVATITNPGPNGQVNGFGTLTVNGNGQDGAVVFVALTQNGSDRGGCRANVTGGAWSCQLTGIAPDSQYMLIATQSGATASPTGAWTDLPVSQNFSTLGAAPVVFVYPTDQTNVAADTPYAVTGTGQAGAEVEVKSFGLISLGKTTVDANGSWSFPHLLSSGDGCYSLTAEQSLQGYPLPNPAAGPQPVIWYPVGSQTCQQTSQFR
jgi:hypothetical protein